jgi:hypothetical protein
MSSAEAAIRPDGALLVPKLVRAARTLGTAPLKVLKILIQRFPSQPVFKPNFAVGRKRFGRFKRCGCHINRIRTFVVLIRQWRAAFSTKCSNDER